MSLENKNSKQKVKSKKKYKSSNHHKSVRNKGIDRGRSLSCGDNDKRVYKSKAEIDRNKQ